MGGIERNHGVGESGRAEQKRRRDEGEQNLMFRSLIAVAMLVACSGALGGRRQRLLADFGALALGLYLSGDSKSDDNGRGRISEAMHSERKKLDSNDAFSGRYVFLGRRRPASLVITYLA